jgi:hypothetical protein
LEQSRQMHPRIVLHRSVGLSTHRFEAHDQNAGVNPFSTLLLSVTGADVVP